MTVYIIGRGAIGGALASQWLEAGCQTVFLCDGERRKRYAASPFRVNGTIRHFSYTGPAELTAAPDVIFLAVKYHNLQAVYPLLDRAMGEHTVLVSLLNGIDSEELLARRYGWDRVVNAFINRIDATLVGGELRFSSSGEVVFGDRTGEHRDNLERVRRILEAGNIGHRIDEDILTAQWKKFMVNIGINQVSALLGAPYRDFHGDEHIRAVARAAMEETIDVAAAMDIHIRREAVDKVFDFISTYFTEGKTSMLQDVEAKRKTEVEMLSGILCELGNTHGIATPVNRMLFHCIKAMENRYLPENGGV